MELPKLGQLKGAKFGQLELAELLQLRLQLALQLLDGKPGRVDDAFGHLVFKVYVFRLEFVQRGRKTERPGNRQE